jgi:hypothetical protein
MYGIIRQEPLHVATTLPWAVQLRISYDTISNMGGFSESDIVVLTSTLNQDRSDYGEPDVKLVISPVNNAGALATHLTGLCDEYSHATLHYMTLYKYSLLIPIRAFPTDGRSYVGTSLLQYS